MKMNTVIFDLGNVLVKYDWETFLSSFEFDETTYRKVADAVFLSDAWQQGDAGISPEEELRLFIEGAPLYEKEIRMVFERLGECIEKYSYTDRLIRFFREKGTLSFIEEFDGGVFSYKEKCIKPDRKLYECLLERYSILPEQALFLDDRKENVEAARMLGIRGEVFTEDLVKQILGNDSV